MKKNIPTINVVSSPNTTARGVEPGSDGDRGCVSCGTVYQGQAYTQYGAGATLVSDARGRYWCLDCATDALANVRRRTDERTEYVYPWTFNETGGPHGQHIRTGLPPTISEAFKTLSSRCEGNEAAEEAYMIVGALFHETYATKLQQQVKLQELEDNATVGAGVPSRSYTREVAAKIAEKANAQRKPEFSYVRLPGGKATVTCTCGWTDPLGPMPVGPFDPAEALAAAGAEHPRCLPSVDPKKVTGQMTLGELAEQRALLGVDIISMFANGRVTGHARAVLIQHPEHGVHLGHGNTEAEAIEHAFSNLRRATLPEPLKALLKDDPKP